MLAEPEYRHPFWGGIVGLHDVGKVAMDRADLANLSPGLRLGKTANHTMSFVP
jgi:hypothetical protein